MTREENGAVSKIDYGQGAYVLRGMRPVGKINLANERLRWGEKGGGDGLGWGEKGGRKPKMDGIVC